MARDPAFLFYTGDFSTGTQFFSDEQVGKYVRLLMAQHQLGHLPEKHMLHICKSYDEDIFSKFKIDIEGLYYNERLEKEALKRQKYSESRSANRSKNNNNISFSYEKHMENKDKDVNINTVKLKKTQNGKTTENGYSGNFKARGEEVMVKRMREGIEALNKARDDDS